MSSIKRYVITRIINYVLVLLIVLSLTYAVMAPIADQALIDMWRETLNARLRSDPKLIESLKAKGISPEEWINQQLEVIKKREGLDKPWYERLPKRVFDMLVFRLGRSHLIRSFRGTRNISDIIFERIPFSVLLFTSSTIILVVLGLIIGLACARKPGSLLDVSFIIYALVGNSLPMWWLAMILVLVFVYFLHLFPPPVEIKAVVARPPPIGNVSEFIGYLGNLLYYMTLPLFTVTVVSLGAEVYLMRNIVLTTMTEDFVFVARAKGLPERDVIYKHVLRAAAPPIITTVLLSITGSLFGGAIITETVFMWPGMGLLYWEAIAGNDTPVVLGLVYLSLLVYLITLAVLDVLYGILDPRVRITTGVTG